MKNSPLEELTLEQYIERMGRIAVMSIISGHVAHPSRAGTAPRLAEALQHGCEIVSALEAAQAACAYLSAPKLRAARFVLQLLKTGGVRHAAPLALEHRSDVRALFLLNSDSVSSYAGEYYAVELIEAATISRAISARIAAEAALSECVA